MSYDDDLTRLCGWDTIEGPAEREVCDRLASSLRALVVVLDQLDRGTADRDVLSAVGRDAEAALVAYKDRVAERMPCDGS
jgi:hypothetical protein